MITGVTLPYKNIYVNEILQYADDASLFFLNEHELEAALNIIETFWNISGLKLNRRKSMTHPFEGYIKKETNSCIVKWLKSNEYIKI